MTTNPLLSKFHRAQDELKSKLIERDEEVDLCLTGLIANEHVLLVGPPGTAKSLLLSSMSKFIRGNTFNMLLTKFSTPEEVWGPLNLGRLKDGVYERCLEGYMAEADFAFLDEIFKASSAILNTMLRALNEQTFKQGTQEKNLPLKLCVAASNEWPSSENGQQELAALFDRFTLRKIVRPITSEGRAKLLYSQQQELIPQFNNETVLNDNELAQARQEAESMDLSSDFRTKFNECLDDLRTAGITPGDRRLRKSIKICRAYAWLAGAKEVIPEHGVILKHVLWDDPNTHIQKSHEIIAEKMDSLGTSISSRMNEARQLIDQTKKDDMGDCIASSKKLTEILDTLRKLPNADDPRVKSALLWIAKQRRDMASSFLEA